MRNGSKIWSAVCVVFFCLAALFWRAGERGARQERSEPAKEGAAAQARTKFVFPPGLGTNAAAVAAGAAAGSPHPFRLRNTSEPLDSLIRNDHAILLANALIDSSLKTGVTIPDAWRSEADPKAYIVQSSKVIDDAFRAKIAAAGGQVMSYVPNNAYLVRIDANGASGLAVADGVQAVLPFEPYYKADERLMAQPAGQAPGPDALIKVVLFPDTATAATAQLTQNGAEILGRDSTPFGPALIVSASSADWAGLARMDGVQLVEPYSRRRMMNDLVRVELGVSTSATIGSTNYLGLSGTNVLINLNDSGVDASHPDLSGRIFSGDPAALQDVDGHGTHVAGIIAGSGAESSTVDSAIIPGSAANADFEGKAPAANIFIIPTDLQFGPLISDEYLQTTAAGAKDNAGRKPFISNNSWGYIESSAYDSSAASYDAATRDALPAVPGMQPLLFVFAAGNSGAGAEDGTGGDADSVVSPGTAKNVITVGASLNLRNITNTAVLTNLDGSLSTNEVYFGWTDDPTQVAFFSSRGNVGIGLEGDYGRFKPDVVAPGTFVASTRSGQWVETNEYSPQSPTYAVDTALDAPLAPYYRYESGTSMATPAVTGVLALFQEYFTARLGAAYTYSPALFKAMLINGAQSLGPQYDFQVQNSINLQGWGLVNLPNSIPYTLSNAPSTWPLQFLDQSPTNALATGESLTWTVNLPNDAAQNAGLKISLVWTDPPGNPAVSVKLVNDLDLIVTNLATGDVYLGNNFPSGATLTQVIPSNSISIATNFTPDVVNNVENIFLSPESGPLSTSYSVTVLAHRVNVNAVTAVTNKIAQDFALVVASADPTAQVTMTAATTTDTPGANVTIVTNGIPLLNQVAGANEPLISGLNGDTNQWSFYVFTNTVVNGSNVAFATFYPPDLAEPRNQSGDVDLYVSTDPTFLSLNPAAVSGAFKSLNRNGTQSIILTDETPGKVYYLGAKSEDQQGVEFGLFAVASAAPFNSEDPFGNIYINGIVAPLGSPIPDGSPKTPGRAYVFGFNAKSDTIRRVTVTNVIYHQLFGDLVNVLTLNGNDPVYLMNHNQAYSSGQNTFVFDDLQQWDLPAPPATSPTGGNTYVSPSDGPGKLTSYIGQQAAGLWLLDVEDDVPTHTGVVQRLVIKVEPKLQTNIIHAIIPPLQFYYDFIYVPANATNLTVTVSSPDGPVEVFLQPGFPPTLNTFAKTATLNPPGGTLTIGQSDSPPLSPGIWFVGFYNPNAFTISIDYSLTLGLDLINTGPVLYGSAAPTPLLDNALTSSTIAVSNSASIYSLNVAVRIDHPRVSDLVLHLVSPSGSRVLLSENRGGPTGTAYGTGKAAGTYLYTAFTEDTNLTSTPIKFASPNFTANPVTIGLVPNTTNVVFTNGFDAPSVKSGLGYKPGTVLSGWTVMKGSVDIFDNGYGIYDNPTTLPNALSINGPGGPGVVSNSFATVPGTGYQVSFDYIHDPSAEAVASVTMSGLKFGDLTNVVLVSEQANNLLSLNWQHTAFTFLANSTNTSIVLSGINPGPAGMLFDTFVVESLISVTGAPYFPEEPMATTFQNEAASGLWTLEVEDNRVGPPNPAITPQILSWALAITFTPNVFGAIPVTPYVTLTNTVSGATPVIFVVNVPSTATAATNILASLTGGNLDMYFNQGGEPITGGGVAAPGDYSLLGPTAGGTSVLLLTNGSGQLPNILEPGQAYYLAVVNDDPTQTNTFTLTVNFNGAANPFNVTQLTNGVPRAAVIGPTTFATTNNFPEYFQYNVSTNALYVEFFTTNQSGPLTLYANYGLPLPTASSYEYEGVEFATNTTAITVDSNSQPVALAPGVWYLAVYDMTGSPVSYSIEAVEFTNALPTPTINLTNGVAYVGSVSGTNIAQFQVYVPPGAHFATNTVINLSGPGVLVYFNQTGPPSGTGINDVDFLGTTTAQTAVMNTTTSSPLLVPGNVYFLGVQNSPGKTGTEFFSLEVSLDVPPNEPLGFPFLINGVPLATNMPSSGNLAAFANIYPNNGLEYFAYATRTNPMSLTFTLTDTTGNLGLYVLDGQIPSPTYFAAASTNAGVTTQTIVLTPTSSPDPLGKGQIWYLGVENYGPATAQFTVEATEVEVPNQITNFAFSPNVTIGVDGSVTLYWTAPSGPIDYIEGKGTLTDPEWLTIPPGSQSSTNGENSITLPPGLPFRFFRIVAPAPTAPFYFAAALSNGVPYTTNMGGSPDSQFYRFNVDTNATNVVFTVSGLNGNAQLLLNQTLLPWPGTAPYAESNALGSSFISLVVATNSQPLKLSPGPWYLQVVNEGGSALSYTIEASENSGTNLPAASIIALTNGVAFTNLSLAPPALSNFFEFVVASNASQVVFDLLTNSEQALLLVNYGSPPTLTNFEYAQTNFGSITITPSSKTPLAPGNWYLGVFNVSGKAMEFAVEAQEQTTGFIINPGVVETTNGFEITWSSIPGDTYYVQGKTNLLQSGWVNVSPEITATGATTTYFVPTNSVFKFFRVEQNSSGGTPTAIVIAPQVSFITNTFHLSFNTTIGATYEIQARTNLASTNWVLVEGPFMATGTNTSYTIPATVGLEFFRVVELPSGGSTPPATFLINSQVSFTGTNFNLTWASTAGAVYEIQGKTNLTDSIWVTVGGSIDATSTSTSASIPASSKLRFFRVVELSSGAAWFRWQSQPLGWPGRRKLLAWNEFQTAGGASPVRATLERRHAVSTDVAIWRESR